jgi:hypothetical protein
MATQIHQSQVPDGMVANVPWGTPLNRWTDRMIERGIDYLRGEDHGSGLAFFPHLYDSLSEQAAERGLVIE